MDQWYKCPYCGQDIIYGTNPCTLCKSSLAWSHQGPVLYMPPSGSQQGPVQYVPQSGPTQQQTTTPVYRQPVNYQKQNMMNWYLEVLKKYAEFSGRARRKEYWFFFLFNMIIAMVLGFIEGVFRAGSGSSQNILSGIYSLAVLIPNIAVGVRRMHDTDHSGWWLLVPIVSLIFAISEGTRGYNRFGPDPKSIVKTT